MLVAIAYDRPPENARPDELDAITQAQEVRSALERLGHRAVELPCTLDLDSARRAIQSLRPDMLFNLVESLGGHARLIHVVPGVLEALGQPFTGCGAEAQFMTSNKLAAKRALVSAGIATPEWTPGGARGACSGDWIVKSVWEHASVGLDDDAVVRQDSGRSVHRVIQDRRRSLGGEWFAERFIAGREFNLSMLARHGGPPRVLAPAEIVFKGDWGDRPRIVGYKAKWGEGTFEYQGTPRRFDFPPRDTTLVEELSLLAMRCWDLFELRGYARVDFRVDEAGSPWVLEVNTNPCLSSDAGFAAAVQRSGMVMEDAVAAILDDARSVAP